MSLSVVSSIVDNFWLNTNSACTVSLDEEWMEYGSYSLMWNFFRHICLKFMM